MTTVAVTVTREGWDAPVDARFGRAAGFAMLDAEAPDTAPAFVPNTQNRQAVQGAGIQAAETVAKAGATVLLTGHVGPKAFRALNAAGIAMYLGGEGTLAEVWQAYREGRLARTEAADVEGHW